MKTTSTVSSRQRLARVDSFQATTSTASPSFTSRSLSYSEPVARTSPATSAEGLGNTPNHCEKCTGMCECSEVEPHPVVPSRPSSPDTTPVPRPAVLAHPSHRFDRSWQQPTEKGIYYHSIKETPSASGHETCSQNDVEPESIEESSHKEYESDDAKDVSEMSDEEAQMSPFRPVAGFQGKFPRNWKFRHARSGSADDHWHKKL